MTADGLVLRETEEGTMLSVRATPGASRAAILGIREGALRVAVTVAAEKGKANKAILGLLSKSLGLRKSQIELHSGATSRDKTFLVRGLAIDELAAIVADRLG